MLFPPGVSHTLSAWGRPVYPAALYSRLLAYHRGPRSLGVDVGTGHGPVARALSASFKRVVGTDHSPAALVDARIVTPPERYPNVRYALSEPENLRSVVEERGVDVAVAAQTPHYLAGPSFMAEMGRVVRDGGTVAVLGYADPVLVECAGASAVLAEWCADTAPDRLGRYWEQPERQILLGKMRTVGPRVGDGVWEDLEGHEYEPGTGGKRTGTGECLLSKRGTVRKLMAYVRTWSAFYRWWELHQEVMGTHEGGEGDVVDAMFDAMRSAEPDWARDKAWKEREIELEWPSGLRMYRRKVRMVEDEKDGSNRFVN